MSDKKMDVKDSKSVAKALSVVIPKPELKRSDEDEDDYELHALSMAATINATITMLEECDCMLCESMAARLWPLCDDGCGLDDLDGVISEYEPFEGKCDGVDGALTELRNLVESLGLDDDGSETDTEDNAEFSQSSAPIKKARF